jgi:hypothetical protein
LLDPDPDPGSQTLPTNNEKEKKISCLNCSLLRAEGFSCSLCVLYKGLGISKLLFLIKKNIRIISAVKVFKFLVIKKPGSGYAIRNKLGPDPDPHLINADPKHRDKVLLYASFPGIEIAGS